jgi:hypothetical protein
MTEELEQLLSSPSVDTSKPATGGRLKTGHHEVAPETRSSYTG